MPHIWIQYIKPVIILFSLMIVFLQLSAKTYSIEEYININRNTKKKIIAYSINTNIDLKEDTLLLPKKSKLIFTQNGCISNGTILGNESSINAPETLILKNVSVGGSWNNTNVSSHWINFPNDGNPCNAAFQSLMTLCKGEKLTHFYLHEGTYYVSAYYRSAPIKVPSNVYWHNKAEIIMLPTNLSWYNTVLLDKVDNVTIDGGSFTGDVRSHIGDEGEWGHGIKCAGATNICLKNITCAYHWGDGIDLIEGLDSKGKATINCDHIDIDSVKCFHNRRQGMSIEAAHNVSIANSEFAYTGNPLYTSPGAGLDIEPWIDNDIKIRNISITRCKFHNNKWIDLLILSNFHQNTVNESNCRISINNCDIGICKLNYSSGVFLNKCIIGKRLIMQNSSNIEFNKCEIPNYTKENSEIIKFKNCKFKIANTALLIIPMIILSGIYILTYKTLRS